MNAMMHDVGGFGNCRECGRPLVATSARSWTSPEEIGCAVCDEGVTPEAFEKWWFGEEPPELDPWETEEWYG